MKRFHLINTVKSMRTKVDKRQKCTSTKDDEEDEEDEDDHGHCETPGCEFTCLVGVKKIHSWRRRREKTGGKEFYLCLKC